MKNLKKIILGMTAGAVLAAGAALAAVEDSTSWWGAPGLVGTWQFEMTVRADAADCTTSPPIPFGPNPFPALASYHEGGTMNEFASRASPSIRSTGFGSWKQIGFNRYRARHTFMEFDPNGLLWRTMVVEQTIRLAPKGNSYEAVGRLELTDISGNVVKICATVNGVRFKV